MTGLIGRHRESKWHILATARVTVNALLVVQDTNYFFKKYLLSTQYLLISVLET